MGDADLADSKTLFSNLRQTLQDVDVEPLKTGRMSSSDELILYCTNSDSPAEVFAEGLYIFDRATRSVGTETPRSGHEAVALSALAICLGQTLTLNQKVCMSLMQILADASREATWRRPFASAVQNPEQYRLLGQPELLTGSILLTALGFLARTVHPGSSSVLGNALRLINNCCSNDDVIRQVVVDNNGISQLLNLANERIEPDFVVSALFNVCNDFEPAVQQLIEGQIPAQAAESGLISRRPLSDDVDVPSEVHGQAPSVVGTLRILLGLTDVLQHQERKPLLADLAELVSRSVVQDPNRLAPSSSNHSVVYPEYSRLLVDLLRGPGLRLAACDTECRVAVCSTTVNLLSQDSLQKCLISGGLVRAFIALAYVESTDSTDTDSEPSTDSETEANLLQCQHAVLKALYSICAFPEFVTAHPLDSDLAKQCIAAVRAPESLGVSYNQGTLPRSAACVILASLTQSEQIAKALVEGDKVHEYLPELLQNETDTEVLYPAINFIGRLALPASNKAILVESGLLTAMRRFFDQDTMPNVQREAGITVRRLVAGSPKTLAIIGMAPTNSNLETPAAPSELAAVLDLFERTDDAALKLEIGRLAIEICRTLWALHSGQPDMAEGEFALVIGQCGQIFADAIAFVILNGEGPGARGEGWFGFAMMSVWTVGGELIVNCLNSEEMLIEVKKVVASGSGPGYQNLRLVLAKMSTMPATTFLPNTQMAVESAASEMALGPIWAHEVRDRTLSKTLMEEP